MIYTPLGHRIFVRYARKPIWFPTAPSKLFRIPDHKLYSEEEVEKIKKLNIDFKQQEELVRNLMNREFYLPSLGAGGLPKEFLERESKEDMFRRKENDELNAKTAEKREKYFSSKFEEVKQRLLDTKMVDEEKLLLKGQEADDIIREKRADTLCLITKENIDQVIDFAMDNLVKYEYFMDRSGKKHFV